ncbi:hypothetical protein [Streptomyces lavendofoliae]|uniref:hypothetical protein n=1 Tax=Streptomyces lavendofoliae TaxID=67314 RepID=UPI00167654B6|nr:hypothetical protein [Streptomyces lavendofoliae]
MARRTSRLTSTDARAGLTTAAKLLRASDHKDAAKATAALDAVLAPGGWKLLRPDYTPGDNLPIYIDLGIREQLKAAAAAEGSSLSQDVSEGFRAFVEGRWTPRQPQRAARNSGATGKKGNLNVRPDDELRRRARERAEVVSAELGWTVTEARLAAAWLIETYGLDTAEPDDKS